VSSSNDRPGVRALAIVPARLASTRLPNKMLLRETGRYLFEHTVRNAASAPVIERALLATDSNEIGAAAREVGIEAISTSPDHMSGTDRVREAFDALPDGDRYDVVVNVQGDEPELPAEALAGLLACFADPAVELATLATLFDAPSEAVDPSVVKVVLDRNGDALYFSRAKLPFDRDPDGSATAGWLRHIGVYAFRPEALRRFCELPRGDLERREGLEQLRWLEAGNSIRVARVAGVPVGIDTVSDYRLFVDRQRKPSRTP